MTAALYGDVGVIRLLVEHGADVRACEPVEVAEREGHTDAVLALCALGAPRAHWPAWVKEHEARDYLAAWERVSA